MTPTRGLRTLPLRTEPLPGESLQSVLESAGRWYGLPSADFAACLGLPGRVDRLTLAADPQQVTDLAFMLMLRPQQVQDTIWKTPRGTPDSGTPGSANQVLLAAAGAYCPRCLDGNGGRWLLEWRLPHVGVCRHHEVRLLTVCPGCQRPPRGREADTKLTRPACCPCGRSLTTAPTASVQWGTPTDAGQVHAHTLLAAARAGTAVPVLTGGTTTAVEALVDLRWLGDRAFGQLHPHDRIDSAVALDWLPDTSCGSTPRVRPSADPAAQSTPWASRRPSWEPGASPPPRTRSAGSSSASVNSRADHHARTGSTDRSGTASDRR